MSLISLEKRPKVREKIRETISKGHAQLETKMVSQDQNYDFLLNIILMKHGGDQFIIGYGIDITEHKKTQRRNEILIKEVRHRVKNNLAIISGMLELELFDLNEYDEKVSLPIEWSRNRIQSIAKVHELLYNTDNLSSVNKNNYINELSEDLRNSIMTSCLDVHIDTDIIQKELNINSAVPLGLLLNELIINSMKYAFRDKGKIKTTVTCSKDEYQLDYRDNGIGFKKPLNLETAKSTGMVIMRTLISQLDADYELNTKNEFHLELRF